MKNPIGKRGIIGILMLISGIGSYSTAQSSAVKELAQLEHDTGSRHSWSDIEGMIGVKTKENKNSGVTGVIIGIGLIGWGMKKYTFGGNQIDVDSEQITKAENTGKKKEI